MCLYNWYWARIYFSRHWIKFLTWFTFQLQIQGEMRCFVFFFSPSSPFSLIALFAFISNHEWLFCHWRYLCYYSSELSRSSLHLVCHLMSHLCVCTCCGVVSEGIWKSIFYQMYSLGKSSARSRESRRKESGSSCIFNEIPQRLKQIQVRQKK